MLLIRIPNNTFNSNTLTNTRREHGTVTIVQIYYVYCNSGNYCSYYNNRYNYVQKTRSDKADNG